MTCGSEGRSGSRGGGCDLGCVLPRVGMSPWCTCACEGRGDEGGTMDTKQGRRPWLFTLAAVAAAGAAGQLGGRRVQGRRVFVRTVWTSSEDEEGSGKLSTGIREAPSTGYGVAVGSPRRRRAHEGREVQGLSGCGKGYAGDRFRVK
jgi:hypothetical protein